MSFLVRHLVGSLAGACALAITSAGQSAPAKPSTVKRGSVPAYAVVQQVESTSTENFFDLRIECSKAVNPSFTRLSNPERIVIDLPDTLVGSQKPVLTADGKDVQTVRVQQFKAKPAVTRVVLDLLGDREYSFEPDENVLIVHVRRAASMPRPEGTYTVGLPSTASPNRGAVVPAGAKLSPGSAVTAGADTAIVSLARGGEVRVCPGTTVSVTPSANGREMMLGMSSGAVELHYRLVSSADTLLTPDFRMLMAGPGDFHFAISADTKGNTCVRALTGNTASVVVSELMGDRTYQVKPVEQIVFHSGRLLQSDANVPLECGCPPARPPQMLASIPAVPGTLQAVTAPADRPVPPPPSLPQDVPKTNPPLMAQVLATDPAPAANGPSNPQIQVDAPFVFRATDPPDVSHEVAGLPPQTRSVAMALPAGSAPPQTARAKKEPAKRAKKQQKPAPEKDQIVILAKASDPPRPIPPAQPAAPEPAKRKGFFSAVRGFFRSLFH